MSARREEAYYIILPKNVLSERADIMNYVPTKDVFLYRTHDVGRQPFEVRYNKKGGVTSRHAALVCVSAGCY